MRLRAGVIGLGMIGGGVAVSMARSGLTPSAVYDVRADASEGLAGVPRQVSAPSDVARLCDVVFLAVLNAEQAHQALTGSDGVLSGASEGLIVVLLSTVSLEAVHELSDLCAEYGVILLDAGVTGGTRSGENGLVVMVGGPDDAVERAMPSMDAFAKTVVHCGSLGAGMVTKLARNAITYGQWAVIHEAAGLAVAGGVPLDRLLRVMFEGDDEGTDRLNLLKGLAAGFKATDERVASAHYLAEKDLSAAQEFAGAVGLQAPIIDRVRPAMLAVYGGQLPEPLPDNPRERGRVMMDRVYGQGFSKQIPADPIPSIDQTVEHLFAEVWSRPYLTTRDRRLLTIGATAMLGRSDLLEVQLRGALNNGEFTVDQLREIALHSQYYAGWGNGTVLQSVVESLVEEARAAR